MKYYLYQFIFLLFFLNATCIEAQETIDEHPLIKHSIYLEAGGLGGYGALVYDRYLFSYKKLIFHSSIGLSTLNLYDIQNELNPDFILPGTFSFLYGQKNHRIEAGLGLIYTNHVKYNTSEFNIARDGNFHPAILLGYRFKKWKRGFTFKVHYYYLLEGFNETRHWAGLGLGYQF